MVDKFGDCTVLDEQLLLASVQTIKKIIVTSGKYKHYHDEIAASVKLGYFPIDCPETVLHHPPISIHSTIMFDLSPCRS